MFNILHARDLVIRLITVEIKLWFEEIYIFMVIVSYKIVLDSRIISAGLEWLQETHNKGISSASVAINLDTLLKCVEAEIWRETI